MYQEIKKSFDTLGIEIPFPHVSIYSGEASKLMPISVKEQRLFSQEDLVKQQKAEKSS